MYTRFPYGTSAENDQLLLPNGMLSVDVERKAIRLHDGSTQGGFEMLGEQAYTPPPLFKGEVSTIDLISGDALATLIGLTAGVAQHSNAGWLHFVDTVDGKTKYVSKHPFRHSISWDQIQARSAVNGNRIVTIQGQQYRIRLLSGASSSPVIGGNGYDHPKTHGSEWNRLFYPIVSGGTTGDIFDSVPGAPGNWAQYNPDLDLSITGGSGFSSWCQEIRSDSTTWRVVRGNLGVSFFFTTVSTNNLSTYGWRPVLELVE